MQRKLRYVLAFTLVGILCIGCGSEKGYEIINETHSTVTGGAATAICTENDGNTNADVYVDGTGFNTAVIEKGKNNLISFLSTNSDYYFSYDTNQRLDSANALFIVNRVGQEQGVIAYTTEGGLPMVDVKTYSFESDTMMAKGYEGKLENDAFPYAVWLDAYQSKKGDYEETLKVLLKFKTLEVQNEFLKGLSFRVHYNFYADYQKIRSFDGLDFELKLNRNKLPSFLVVRREEEDKRVSDIYIAEGDKALATLTFGKDYVDVGQYKAKYFKLKTIDGAKIEGMRWKVKKNLCYGVTEMTYEGKEWLQSGMFLFVGTDKKDIETAVKTLKVGDDDE